MTFSNTNGCRPHETTQAIRMLHACGMPKEDLDFINGQGPPMQELLVQAQPRMTQFTGSSKVAEVRVWCLVLCVVGGQ
jgi:delta 1-pyrroline-5-carboxylate dehydrogenase